MKVLVTGASARFGPFVIKELSERYELVLFSRRKPPDEAIAHHQWIHGDLTNYRDCLKAVKGVDVIQHLAAQSWPSDHPRRRERASARGIPFDAVIRSNILGTYYLLQAAVQEGIKLVVMASSNCATGHGYRISTRPFPITYLPIDEQHPSDVEDSYGYSKLVGEEMLASYTRAFGMRTYALRLAAIHSPGGVKQMAERVRAATGWSEWMWCWVASVDAGRAHRLVMEAALDKDSPLSPHDVFFCTSDDTSALEPSMELVERFRPDLIPAVRELKGYQSFMSSHKLKSTLGWRHQTDWRKPLKNSSSC